MNELKTTYSLGIMIEDLGEIDRRVSIEIRAGISLELRKAGGKI